MQRVQLLDLALYFQRACKSNGHIADTDRYRVAINKHIAALLVDNKTRTIVVAISNAGQRVRQIECNDDQ